MEQVWRGDPGRGEGVCELSVSAPLQAAVQGNADELCEKRWAESKGLKLAEIVPHCTTALMQLKMQAHSQRQRGTCRYCEVSKHVMQGAKVGPAALHQDMCTQAMSMEDQGKASPAWRPVTLNRQPGLGQLHQPEQCMA